MKWYLALWVFCLTPVYAQNRPPTTEGLAELAELVLGKNGGDRLFYYPTRTAPYDPKRYGIEFEDVTFKSGDGLRLHGWFMSPARGVKPKGAIVFSHGNAGSVGHHIGFTAWMVRAGYQVFLYDYRGYGKSEGEITRKGMLEDVRAAITYVATRKDVDRNRVISFGHSLGGAQSLAALGEKKMEGLRAVVSFAGFASYKDMARRFAGDAGADLVTDDLSARDLISKIAPVPVLIVHGTADGTVPIGQGEILFAKAGQPKAFFKVKGGSHTGALAMNNGEYRKRILDWLDEVVK